MPRVRQSTGQSITSLRQSFRRSLRARNLSERTVTIYDKAASALDAYLEQKPITAILTADVEDFMKSRLRDASPATANQDFRSLQALFKWAEADDIIPDNPMLRMTAPRVPPKRTEVIDNQAVRDLLRTCEGRDFADIRDTAIIMSFFDTGCRLAEIAGLKVSDVDLDRHTFTVIGKGNRPRAAAYGQQAENALDKYIRKRAQTRYADSEQLWIGKYGPMTRSGLAQVITERCRQAGIDHIHPHQFRHTYAHNAMSSGMSDTNLMQQGGWNSPQMLRHYGAVLREERAVAAAREISPMDRLARQRRTR